MRTGWDGNGNGDGDGDGDGDGEGDGDGGGDGEMRVGGGAIHEAPGDIRSARDDIRMTQRAPDSHTTIHASAALTLPHIRTGHESMHAAGIQRWT